VLVTDRTTPLSGATGHCVQISAHSARCIDLSGIDTVDANFSMDAPGSSFTLVPGSDASAAPMFYMLQTSNGDDTVSIPVSRGGDFGTLGGNDTLTIGDPTGVRGMQINAGAGDDHVRLTTADWGTLDCGDGIDDAQVVAPRAGVTGCETVTP
jgi:hypothetical protein